MMRKIGKPLALVLAVVLMIALVGCTSKGPETKGRDFSTFSPIDKTIDKVGVESHADVKPSQKYSFGCTIPQLNDEYWIAFAYGFEDECKQLGIDFNLITCGGYGEITTQVKQIEDYNVKGVVMAVAIAANIGYATPISTPPITMTLSAGYRFKDYVKVGGLLNLLAIVLMIALLPLIL